MNGEFLLSSNETVYDVEKFYKKKNYNKYMVMVYGVSRTPHHERDANSQLINLIIEHDCVNEYYLMPIEERFAISLLC